MAVGEVKTTSSAYWASTASMSRAFQARIHWAANRWAGSGALTLKGVPGHHGRMYEHRRSSGSTHGAAASRASRARLASSPPR